MYRLTGFECCEGDDLSEGEMLPDKDKKVVQVKYYDDDGICYFGGILQSEDGDNDNYALDILEELVMPEYGCTSCKMLGKDGVWETM